MYCHNCGKEMPDEGKFCPSCGSAVSGVSGESGMEKSLGDFKTLVHESKASAEVNNGLAVSMLSERYELGEEIGRGGFAVVYRATDKKLNRTVAIKKLHPEKADATTMARFRREALSIASLNHRNIVQVYDVGEDPSDGSLYLVMELVEGGSLRELLKKKGKLPLPEATVLLRGMAQGLSHAHRKNLVHRDIKPANILLDGNEPKIVDFGLAQAGRDSELSMSGYGMGTVVYMPPEQRRDAKGVNHTADIYSLGKVFYEMLTGEMPDTIDPSEIPPPPVLSEIIFKCVKPKPEDRFFSVDELLRELGKIDGRKKAQKAQKTGAVGNECPQCGVTNAVGIKFCVGCGGGLFRNCPECGKENSIKEQFCGSCGTEVEGFLAAQETLGRMSRYASEKKWSRVLKESEGWNAEIRLPGKKGKELRLSIKQSAARAKQTLHEIERLERSVDEASSLVRKEGKTSSDSDDPKKPSTHFAQANAAGSRVYDERLRKHLEALRALKDLPTELQLLLGEVRKRMADEKTRLAKARKRKMQKMVAGIAALIVAGVVVDQSILAFRKGAFKTAIEHRQMEKAEATANKLGDRFNTTGDLEALQVFFTEKATFEHQVAGQRKMLAKYGGADWSNANEKIRMAEKPGSPLVATEAYRAARPLVQRVQTKLATMLAAEAAFSKGWKKSADGLKRFEPATYAKLINGQGQVRNLTDPLAATTGWKKLAADLKAAERKIEKILAQKKAMLAEKSKFVRAVSGSKSQAAPIRKFAQKDWTAVQKGAKQAEVDEKAMRFADAENGYKKATDGLGKLLQTVVYQAAMSEAQKAEKAHDWATAYAALDRALKSGVPSLREANALKGKLDLKLKPARDAQAAYEALLSKVDLNALKKKKPTEWAAIERMVQKAKSTAEPQQTAQYYQLATTQLRNVAAQLFPKDLRKVEGASYASLSGLASGSAEAQAKQKAAAVNLPLEVKSAKTGIAFRLIPAGRFTMGSPSGEKDRDSDEKQHQVTLSKPFYCGKFEVTQAQWKQVMGSSPSKFTGAQNPVEQVSWDDCQTFLKKLCALEGVPAGTYRLLTEAQWEYACRAGTTGSYTGSLDAMGWYKTNSGSKTHAVGSKQANAWGLYDMHGNVWEWCGDWYSDGYGGNGVDPVGPSSGSYRVYRGGSWYRNARYCRSALRDWNAPGSRNDSLGFRLLRTAPLP